jgi:hypothetical protein
LFDRQDLDRRKKERRDPNLNQAFETAVENARRRIDGVKVTDYPEFRDVNNEFLGGGDFSPHWPEFLRWRKGLHGSIPAMDGAYLYTLTGDREAGETAMELLLHICKFENWNHPWMIARGTHMYYPVGYTAYRLAMTFDLLYPLLTQEERNTVLDGIVRNAIIPAYEGEVLDNHIPSNISNHLGVSCTGALLACVALMGEDPENPYMEPYLSGVLTKFEAHLAAGYLPDKSYAESFGYHHMDADMTAKAAACLERNFGIDLTGATSLGDAYLFSIYSSNPGGQDCLDMGDGTGNWGANGRMPLLWAAYRSEDPLAWDRYLWATGLESIGASNLDFYDYLWRPVGLDPIPVDLLPTSRWFWAKGFAAFRSDWKEEGLQFLYRAGPHSNHYHLDQGNFLLRYGGETLIDEGGYAKYYENNYYRPFYTQAIAHNTVLIGNYPESQDLADLRNDIQALDAYPRIVQCTTGEIIDALESELASVYKGRLESFRRSFVFLKPDYLVLHDEIVASEPETPNWLFHAPEKATVEFSDSTFRFRMPAAELRAEVLIPSELDADVRTYPDREKEFLTLSTPSKADRSEFLAVLIPSKNENHEDREGWKVTHTEEPGWIGARIERNGAVDEIRFRRDSENANETGEFESDCDRFAVSYSEGGELARLWIRNGSYFKSGDAAKPIFAVESSKRTTFALAYNSGAYAVESNSPSEFDLKIQAREAPTSVRLNGKDANYRYSPEENWIVVGFD